MPTVTLAESAKLTQDDLIKGIAETIITVNPIYEILPFDPIEGNALAYNRENALGDVQTLGVGGTITAKNPATFTRMTSTLTTIIGDAEVNGLIQATRSKENDQQAVQVASKAKSVGRKFQDMMAVGTGAGDDFTGVLGLVHASKILIQDTAGSTTNGGPLSFQKLDELIDSVTDKEGTVDFIMMHARTIRSFKALLRGLGGASISEVLTLPSGRTVPTYNGIPIFRNDYLPLNQAQGSLATGTSVVAGTWDDGSRTHGVAGLTAQNAAGIVVEDVGIHQSRDERITRVKWYAGLVCFNQNGLAVLSGVSN